MPRPSKVRSEAEGGSGAKAVEERKLLYSINGDKLPCEEVPNYMIKCPWNSWKWYILIFKPLNSNYDPAYNALDWIRIKFCKKAECYLITREQNATKVHYNLMVYTDEDMTTYHEYRAPRYMIYSQLVRTTPFEVYKYITKEYYVQGYPWLIYRDFNYNIKNKICGIINGNEEIDQQNSEDEEIRKALERL